MVIKLVANEIKERMHHDWLKEIDPNMMLPEGLKVESSPYVWEGEKKICHMVVHEGFAPARYVKSIPSDFVVRINEMNYLVIVKIDYDRHDNYPNGAMVYFSPTNEPETEFETWSHAEAIAKEIERNKKAVERCKKKITLNRAWLPEEVPEYADDKFFSITEEDLEEELDAEARDFMLDDISSYEKDIYNLENGCTQLRAPYDFQIFGSPHFIQSPIFPMYHKKVAQNLCTLETGWGDSGNINILFTCDEFGKPNAVWFEASCC